MLFSRWQKQNPQLRTVTWLAAFAVAVAIVLLIPALTTAQKGPVSMVLTFVFKMLFSLLANRFLANSIVGAFKSNYQTFDRDLRTMLKEQAIPFYRKAESKNYSFEFPSQSLTMRVQPYTPPMQRSNVAPFTRVTFKPLNSSNMSFATELTEKIDAMVAQSDEQSAEESASA